MWIAGAGAVSCLGLGKESLIRAVLANQSGINDQGLGPVTDQDKLKMDQSLAPLMERRDLSWPLKLTLWAAREAMGEAGWDQLTDRDGLILATTTGQIPLWDRALSEYYQNQISEEQFKKVFRHYSLGTILDDISVTINAIGGEGPIFRGPRGLVSSACSASTQAIALASMWIESGKADRVLVGGVEVLCDLTVEGFRSLKLLTPGRCRPFDAARTGINLSEGAAFFCVQREPASSRVKVSGYGMSTDSYHMTAPHPQGDGSLAAMQAALTRAGVEPRDIDWVHAHGTGSLHNDLSESAAIARLFEGNLPFVSSTKWHHGHALGASGILEAVIDTEALKRGVMIATRGLENIDPGISLPIEREHRSKPGMKYVLKNTLGFGGANACFLLEAR